MCHGPEHPTAYPRRTQMMRTMQRYLLFLALRWHERGAAAGPVA